MKIDEAIERVKYTNLHCDMYEDCIFNGECGECEEALDMVVETLQWYREQDLIRRDVALSRTEDVYFAACTESEKSWKCYLYDNCGECKTHQVELEIEQIPKAEYGGSE